MNKLVLIISIIFYQYGCSSNDVSDYNGNYKYLAFINVDFDSNGARCAESLGTMNISEGVVIGEITNIFGVKYSLEGAVTDKGKISGVFSNPDFANITIEGTIISNSINGNWADAFGCTGSYSAQLL
ncbi:MAG: hypothetical protein QM500_14640 [Methylococcales bacterium]